MKSRSEGVTIFYFHVFCVLLQSLSFFFYYVLLITPLIALLLALLHLVVFSCIISARKLWRDYFASGVDGVVFIVDAVDKERFPEAKRELDVSGLDLCCKVSLCGLLSSVLLAIRLLLSVVWLVGHSIVAEWCVLKSSIAFI